MKLFELYQEEPGGTFTHDGEKYRLNYVLAKADSIDAEDMPVADLKWILGDGKDLDDGGTNYKRVKNADTSIPILITKWNGKYVVIDGIHRLAKAVGNELTTISCKLIPNSVLKKAII